MMSDFDFGGLFIRGLLSFFLPPLSEAAVTGNKKLRCWYVEADYRQT